MGKEKDEGEGRQGEDLNEVRYTHSYTSVLEVREDKIVCCNVPRG